MAPRVVALLLFAIASLPCLAGDDAGRAARAGRVHALRTVLRRPSERRAAWAAYYAAEEGLHELVPALEGRLRMLAMLPPPCRPAHMDAVLLDALVRLDARPAADVLVEFAPYGAGLVLLLRHPAHYRDALAGAFPAVRSVPRLAVGNALARERAPGFAARILAETEVELFVRVKDIEAALGPWRDPSDSVCGDGFLDLPGDWPPYPRWDFEQEAWADPDAERVAPGPVDVQVWRGVFHERVWFAWNVSDQVDWPPVRRGWLATLAGDPTDVPALPARVEMEHRYVGRQPWARALRRLHAEQADVWWAWVRRLYERGLLTREEARAAMPRLRFRVVDQRRDRRRRLPPVPACETAKPFAPERRSPTWGAL